MGNEESMETKVAKHGLQLDYIEDNIGSINSTLKEMLDLQKEVIVIMERQSNHEEYVRDGFTRINERVNEHIAEDKERLKIHGAYCDIVEHNAGKGKLAYDVVKWCGVTVGAIVLGSMMTMWLHAVKIWG